MIQDELFVFLGTHQPLELVGMKASQKNDYLPVHLQSALDDQGRQRLHGAFTGGRSAGYFNTVGSKEGFRPMEFSSSRSSRANVSAARPEDFMDDEDIKEIKAFSIGATQEYDQFGTSMAEIESRKLLADNIGLDKTALSEIAKHLAGDLIVSTTDSIGNRLLKQMGWKEGQGVGPRIKRNKPSFKDDDAVTSGFSFAPLNSTLVLLKAKKDKFGIGYSTGSDGKSTESNLAKRGSGFGVGIFEEEDDDIYDERKAEYEATIENDLVMSSRITTEKRHPENSSGKDGKHSIQGFVIVGKTVLKSFNYPDPVIPLDFTGNHIFAEEDITVKYGALNPDQRRDILGETALKGPDISVFSYIKAQDQQRLESYITKAKKTSFSVPKISKEIAESALRGFMPFGNDKIKQQKYNLYLTVMAEQSKNSLDTICESEFQEFSRAAEMYRPMSSFMASRFVSATTPDTAAAPMPQFPESQNNRIKKSEDAAKKGKFGIFTRTAIEWYPERLLCKRFDVQNPYPDFKAESEEAKKKALEEKQALNEKTMESLKQERNRMLAANEILESRNDDDLENEIDGASSLVQEKPPMDIFKAIFADSDSDSESESTHKEAAKDINKNIAKAEDVKGSELFRPVFRKKEDRKSGILQKKASKTPSVRPSSVGVKLVFDFDEESYNDKQHLAKHIKISNDIKNSVDKAESEDEWVEAPQLSVSRQKASDLI